MKIAEMLLQIQDRVKEIQLRKPTYRDLELVEGTEIPAHPQVGIWWLYKGKVIQHSIPASTCPDPSDPQCVDLEHIWAWPHAQQAFGTKYPDFLQLGYADLPRGRIWFHRGFKQFSITCSPAIAKDPSALRLVSRAFGLVNKAYQVIVDPQYPLIPHQTGRVKPWLFILEDSPCRITEMESVLEAMDEREGWVRASTAPKAISLLKKLYSNLEVISLDHDLGPDGDEDPGSGMDVVLWLEKQVPSVRIIIHSANLPAGNEMFTRLERVGFTVRRIFPLAGPWIDSDWQKAITDLKNRRS